MHYCALWAVQSNLLGKLLLIKIIYVKFKVKHPNMGISSPRGSFSLFVRCFSDVAWQSGLWVQWTAAVSEPGPEGSRAAQGGLRSPQQLRETDLWQAGCGGDQRWVVQCCSLSGKPSQVCSFFWKCFSAAVDKKMNYQLHWTFFSANKIDLAHKNKAHSAYCV